MFSDVARRAHHRPSRPGPRRWVARLAASAVTALTIGLLAAPAHGATESRVERFVASDGVSLRTTVTGEAPLAPRPTIVEFTPYGKGGAGIPDVPGVNRLTVEIRGTGDSDGRFDALGPRTQKDVAETLRWACDRPWSDGRLGLNGFSASAITIYNSLHHELPCVEAAVLKSGTHELYRDLLVPGGVNNIVPGVGVLAMIGAPALAQGPERLFRNPLSALDTVLGLADSGLSELLHPTLDTWWRERGMRGNVNDFPTLVVNGWFDVESRGAFQGFQALREHGSRLLVVGAHDGAPKGTDGGADEVRAWWRHHLVGDDNGADREPRVKLWVADGGRETYLDGAFVRRDADDWPVPGTRWETLALDATRSGRGRSLNDGTLTPGRARQAGLQSYLSLPSLITATDVPTTALVGAAGLNELTRFLPILTDMTLAEPLGLSYVTPPLREDVVSVGPGSVELVLSSTAPTVPLWVVVSDVGPDGNARPVATGRLSTAFPDVVTDESLKDPETGRIVQPYNDLTHARPAAIGQARRYHVELWPIGNRFKRGHRIALHLVGPSLGSLPSLPALNTVDLGGSRLHLPVLPESDLGRALGR
ncbi:MAG: CocE/NonD family hydrolase [Solirubrobacteraceae bacterium]|nr:CocE/NonD family hydrolase [Solirubrobacteraceae bacterium]